MGVNYLDILNRRGACALCSQYLDTGLNQGVGLVGILSLTVFGCGNFYAPRLINMRLSSPLQSAVKLTSLLSLVTPHPYLLS